MIAVYGSIVSIGIVWPYADVQCSEVVNRTLIVLIGHNVAYL